MVKLEAFMDATVVINLPDDIEVSDIKWFSVWCRQAEVSVDHGYCNNQILFSFFS